MVGIRGGARRVAYVRGEGGDPLTSLLSDRNCNVTISDFPQSPMERCSFLRGQYDFKKIFPISMFLGAPTLPVHPQGARVTLARH